jgi:hypothetical protein
MYVELEIQAETDVSKVFCPAISEAFVLSLV